jgi:outer membrane protein insertion porin family
MTKYLLILLCIATPAFAQLGHEIEDIEVRGNEKTRIEIIHQVLPVKIGQTLNKGDLDRSRQVLERLQFFRTVFVNVKPGSEKGKAILVVYVQEKRFGDLGVSLEYSELDGFGIATDAYYANLRGEGKLIGVEYGLGERLKYWGFRYSDPLFLKTNQAFHIQITGSSADRDIFRNSNPDVRGRYDLKRIGFSLGVGQPSPHRAYHLVLKYAFEAVQTGAFQRPIIPTGDELFANEIAAAEGRENLSKLTLQLIKQSAITLWGSVQGTDFNAGLTLSSKALGSVANFIRLRTELYRHQQLFPGHILSFGGKAGATCGTPPFYERFYIDGPNQLRGIERRVIGPEGGTQFFTAEAIYAIDLKTLGRAYVFAESGGVRRTIGNTQRNDADAAFGIGFLLFNRVDISFGISTGTLIVKSHRFGGIKLGL